jgi:hypothetical protein
MISKHLKYFGRLNLLLLRSVLFAPSIFKKKKKILFVGQIHSPHFSSFFNFFLPSSVKKKCSFKFLKSYPVFPRKILNFKGYTIVDYIFEAISTKKSDTYFSKLHNEGIAENQIKLYRYNRLLKRFNPDIVWMHDLQSAGYLLENSLPKDLIICLTTYGNDLYFYRNSKIHRDKIRLILSYVDFLHVETIRDRKIAVELGYRGRFFPIASATLNLYNLEASDLTFDKVKSIFLLVKGDDGIRTQNEDFYKFLLSNPDKLQYRDIVVFSSGELDEYYAEKLRALNINIVCLGSVLHRDLLELIEKSKFFLSLTLSDGIANLVVESASLNCIPFITKHNGCTELFSEDRLMRLISVNLSFNDLDFNKIIHLENNQELMLDVLSDLRGGINSYFSEDKQKLFSIFCQKNLID